jgi:hypothetical protein
VKFRFLTAASHHRALRALSCHWLESEAVIRRESANFKNLPLAFMNPVSGLSGCNPASTGHWMRRPLLQHPATKGRSENFHNADVQFVQEKNNNKPNRQMANNNLGQRLINN